MGNKDKNKRMLLYGDQHLSSKNYGGHKNYPKVSMDNFIRIGDIAENDNCGLIAGAGDLTYGRFSDLNYRLKVEEQFERQLTLTEGRRYEIKGNHDTMTTGLSEYEFYEQKGMFSKPEYVDFGCVRMHLVSYGKETMKLDIAKDKSNFVFAHNYFKYSNSVMPNYGEGIELDGFETWKDVDMIIAGHIHEIHKLGGYIITGEDRKEIPVFYLGCPNRPSYMKSGLDEVGNYLIIDGSGDDPKLEVVEFELPSIEDTFNIAKINELAEEAKRNRADVSDMVENLVKHKRNVADPEVIIDSLNVYSRESRKLAKELYREALG